MIALQNSQALALVPLARTLNIPDAALQSGAKISLVLLADPARLADAPHLSGLDQVTDAGAQDTARGDWGS